MKGVGKIRQYLLALLLHIQGGWRVGGVSWSR